MMSILLGLGLALGTARGGQSVPTRTIGEQAGSLTLGDTLANSPADTAAVGDSTVLARGVQCRPGFKAFALKQDLPWAARAAGLCIMPIGDGPWPWPPGRTTGIVIMPRTPFTSHESSQTPWVVVNGLVRAELDEARVLVGRTPYPTAKYLAVEGPYP
jgi:hypothetical protein